MSLPRLYHGIMAERCTTYTHHPKDQPGTLMPVLTSSTFARASTPLLHIARSLRQISWLDLLVSLQKFSTLLRLQLTWTKTSAPWTSHALPCNPAILPDADGALQRFKKGAINRSRVPVVATFSSPPMCCRLPQLELDRILRNWPGDRLPGPGESRGGIGPSHLLPAPQAPTV